MRLRPAPWLAPAAVVAVLAAAAVGAVHGELRSSAPASGSSAVRGAFTSSYGSDLVPANAVHSAPRYTPPSPAAPARPATVPPPVAAPAVALGSYQQALINRDRAAAGLPPLRWSGCLASIAVSNAARLSRQGWVPPYHTNGASLDLGCRLGNQAGENVGYWSGGINDVQLNTMFMNSPEHRANILGPYHYVATAWAVAPDGAAYIAVEFG